MKRWIGAGVVLAIVAIVLMRCRAIEPSRHARSPAIDPASHAHLVLSVQVFRALYDERQRRARELAATRYAVHPKGATSRGRAMIDPSCDLGPGELCKELEDPIEACDAGDGASCLAVGQLLSETPPRPLVAVYFFSAGCDAGDSIACDRMHVLQNPAAAGTRCEDDVFVCAWRAYRVHDPAALDEACTLGVGDACLSLIGGNQDPDRERAYIESACQLGQPGPCAILGQRLLDRLHARPLLSTRPRRGRGGFRDRLRGWLGWCLLVFTAPCSRDMFAPCSGRDEISTMEHRARDARGRGRLRAQESA